MKAFIKLFIYYIFAILFDLIIAIFIMLCWNSVIPNVGIAAPITYFQAFLLKLLCTFLFKFRLELDKNSFKRNKQSIN